MKNGGETTVLEESTIVFYIYNEILPTYGAYQ